LEFCPGDFFSDSYCYFVSVGFGKFKDLAHSSLPVYLLVILLITAGSKDGLYAVLNQILESTNCFIMDQIRDAFDYIGLPSATSVQIDSTSAGDSMQTVLVEPLSGPSEMVAECYAGPMIRN